MSIPAIKLFSQTGNGHALTILCAFGIRFYQLASTRIHRMYASMGVITAVEFKISIQFPLKMKYKKKHRAKVRKAEKCHQFCNPARTNQTRE